MFLKILNIEVLITTNDVIYDVLELADSLAVLKLQRNPRSTDVGIVIWRYGILVSKNYKYAKDCTRV